MKTFKLVAFMLFVQNISAQTTFSISPLINKKLLICGYPNQSGFGFYSENKPSNLHNPYYEYDAVRYSHRPGFNIGLRLSASLMNNKHILSLEWSQDIVGTMSRATSFTTPNTAGLPPQPYNTYLIGSSYFQDSYMFYRYSISYGHLLNRNKLLSKFYLLTDISFARPYFNRSEWSYNNFPGNNAVYYHNDAVWVRTEHRSLIWDANYFFLGIGLKGDMSIKINEKPRYLFSLETIYRQGTKVMSSRVSETLIEDNGQLVAFSNELFSKGSGIYFQVSRKFKLYTLKSKK